MYLQHPNAFNYPHKLCLTHRHLKIQIFDLSKCCVLRLGGWENQPAAMLCSHSEANVKLLPKSFKWRLTWHMLRSLIGGARNYSIHGHALTNNDISLKGTLIYFGLLLNRLVRHSLQPFPQQGTANKETIKPTEAALDISSNFFFKSSIWPADSRLHPPRLLYPFLFLQGSFTNDPSWFSFPNCYWQISKINTGWLILSELCFNLAGDNLSACENAEKMLTMSWRLACRFHTHSKEIHTAWDRPGSSHPSNATKGTFLDMKVLPHALFLQRN